jgi:hypothetical protein
MEQCKGITKSGNRCKNTQGLVNGYCRLHKDQAPEGDDVRTDEKPRNTYPQDERSFADVASDVHQGVSAIWLVVTALVSLVLFWFLKGLNKRKRKKDS